MSNCVKQLKRIHFGSIVLLIVNFIIYQITQYTLTNILVFFCKVVLYISAIILFFALRKPFTKISLYFSAYIFAPIITLLGWFIGTIGIILTSIFIFSFFPKEYNFDSNNFVVYKKFQGFLGGCCKYELYERKYWLIEEKLADFESEEYNFPNANIKIVNNEVLLKFDYKEHNYTTNTEKITDSIIKFRAL